VVDVERPYVVDVDVLGDTQQQGYVEIPRVPAVRPALLGVAVQRRHPASPEPQRQVPLPGGEQDRP
jgi:hypothetical protein